MEREKQQILGTVSVSSGHLEQGMETTSVAPGPGQRMKDAWTVRRHHSLHPARHCTALQRPVSQSWSLASCLPLRTVSRKGSVAMGTHVQLFYLQKITHQPTWLEHIPFYRTKLPLVFFTSAMTRSLSEEVEKRVRGFRPQERWSSGQRRQRILERSRPFSKAQAVSPCLQVGAQAGAS